MPDDCPSYNVSTRLAVLRLIFATCKSNFIWKSMRNASISRSAEACSSAFLWSSSFFCCALVDLKPAPSASSVNRVDFTAVLRPTSSFVPSVLIRIFLDELFAFGVARTA
jgi:hypothetical protein